MTNNQGIFHLNLGGRVACKNRNALMFTPVAEFRTAARRCVRCVAVLAKLDASAAKKAARAAVKPEGVKFRFNTGRMYQPQSHKYAGQVIEVELVAGFGNVIYFRDLSRGLDGAFHCVHVGMSQDQIQRRVMHVYDHNEHKAINHFEYLQRRGEFDAA